MSKLLQDEKVQALVTKHEDKATKAERKRVLDLVKGLTLPEDKDAKKQTQALLKDLSAAIKAA